MEEINNLQNQIKNLKEEIEKIIAEEKIFNQFLSIGDEGINLNYKGYIIYCNKKYADIFGYEKNELIGENILVLCPPEEKEFWEDVLKKGKEGEFETSCIRKDGVKIYVRLIIKNIKIGERDLRFVSLRDITNEKLKIVQIKEAEEKYRILTETLLDGIIVINLEGKILFSNPIGANLFNFEKVEDFIGKNIFDFIIHKELFEKNLKLISENKSGYLIETEIKDIRGSKFVIESIGRKIIFKGEEAILLCLRDVTERKIMIDNIKEALKKQKRILVSAVSALSETFTQRDLYTSIHQKRVTKLSLEIAKKLKFPGSLIEGLEMASLLHDIGKISIPVDILLKPGKLTDIEKDFIRMHPEYGSNIVKKIEFPWDISKIIYQHHERINGSGYPCGLREDEIIPEAKVLSVADVIEAMFSYRHYRVKKNYSLEEIIKELEDNSGILYDKNVVDAAVKILKKGFDFEI
ncbi:MAG: HD domain-containing phosphohydrolase [Candidatus Ratteibacteria bacterium]